MATAKNSQEVSSGAASGAAINKDCTHVSLWDKATGGNALDRFAISNNPSPLEAGEQFKIAAEGLVLTRNPGTGESQEMAKRALKGMIEGGVWVQFHSQDPGNNYTAGVIGVIGRASIPEGDWTIA